MKALFIKEIRSYIREKVQFWGGFGFIVLFGFIYTLRDIRMLDNYQTISLLAAMYGAYVFSWISFNGERMSRSLPSLLASPLTMREIFIGKMLALQAIIYVMVGWGIVVSLLMVLVGNGATMPGLSTLFACFITIPIWGGAFGAMLGLMYLVFGNPFILRFIFIFLFVSFTNPDTVSAIMRIMNSQVLLSAIGLAVIALLCYFAGMIDKERIITI